MRLEGLFITLNFWLFLVIEGQEPEILVYKLGASIYDR